jgi:hypothetical protein
VNQFDAYATDCRLYGLVDSGESRLTDFLNANPELVVHEARLESLADGHVVDSPELTVSRDELCAVVASGPRGEAARRLRTHATRVVVDLGAYRIVGSVHGTPASDPVAIALRREAWVPLTEATVTYRRGADEVTDDVDTLLVNRPAATTFRAEEEVSVLLPWEGRRLHPTLTARAVDLTGMLADDVPADPDEDVPRASEPTV